LDKAIAQEEGTTVELDNDVENDDQDEMGGFELGGFEPDNDFAQDGKVFILIFFNCKNQNWHLMRKITHRSLVR